MPRIILASSSERKNRLFGLLGLPFESREHKFDEKSVKVGTPEEHVIKIAVGKAISLKDDFPDSLILGLDTVVSLNGEILEKPKNNQSALKMLKKLNNTIHRAITGLCVLDAKNGKIISQSVSTNMHFKKLTPAQLNSYLAKENVLDVAGAYNHEKLGCVLVKKIDGDYYNSIGMPLSAIADILNKFGIKTL